MFNEKDKKYILTNKAEYMVNLFDQKIRVDEAGVLFEKFIIPPFSILDSRQGYWKDRKQAWMRGLGIKSELGRSNMRVSGSFGGSVPNYYSKKEKTEKELGIKLTNKEFEEEYLPAILSDTTLAYTDTGGLLSVFDPVVCELFYRWFCPRVVKNYECGKCNKTYCDDIPHYNKNTGIVCRYCGEELKEEIRAGQIIDCFAGGAVRGVVADFLGYRYTGVDISEEQTRANTEQAKIILGENNANWITGNSLNIDKLCEGLRADFIFSCPPYYDLEQYTDNPEDLSNLDYEEFKKQYKEIIQKTCSLLKDNRFASFVVGEIRDKKTGEYRNFVNYTTQCFIDAGLKYWNEVILLNVAGSVPMRVSQQFQKSRKVGKVHQNILTFYKGNPDKIRDIFNDNIKFN